MDVESSPIAELSADPANARTHGERNIDAIKASLRRFGQQKPIVVDSSGVVRAGNGTLEAAQALGWDAVDIVRTPLQGSEATAYAIADNRSSELAEWDEEVLAAILEGLQFDDPELLAAAGFDQSDLDALLDDDCADNDDTYTNKIVSPIYEPKGERPPLSALIDRGKTLDLMDGIAATKLPDDVKEFMRLAAERHTVFNFRQIAEYYCHADATLQDLMERSGMVIIDFDKAIEYGFVHLTERLGALADLEESDADEG